MASYKFKGLDKGYEVYMGKRRLGTILPAKEVSGRHSFYLGCDNRKRPRLYRGKQQAAEALQVLDDLLKQAKGKRWSHEMLVMHAWSNRPNVSDQ
ncbi:MAG: hypothetical protein AAGF97_01025 [Planctomycetota bacterium]